MNLEFEPSNDRVFTRYVRALRDDPDSAEQIFEELWDALRRLVRRELARAGLSTSPPRFVGVLGSESWSPDALDELLVDAYTFSFIDRLRALQAQLDTKPNIDGLITLNVRNFLHERQRQNDPIGYRVFEVLRDGVLDTIERGAARVIEGDRKVRNDTVLSLAPTEAGSSEAQGAENDAAPEEFAEGWANRLLPELVTGRSAKARAQLRGRFAELFAEAEAAGVTRIAFKPLVDLLKRDTRSAWRAVLHPPTDTAIGDDAEIELVAPLADLPDSDASFDGLAACVLESIQATSDPTVTARLEALWNFLVAQSLDTRTTASQRRISTLLEIPRDALPKLFERLEEMTAACRSANRESGPLPGARGK